MTDGMVLLLLTPAPVARKLNRYIVLATHLLGAHLPSKRFITFTCTIYIHYVNLFLLSPCKNYKVRMLGPGFRV